MSQVDQVQSGTYTRMVLSSVITPGSIAANSNTEVTTAGVDIHVGEWGFCFLPSSVTPANAVRPNLVRCTTEGSAIISYNNPTAGALTPTAATATAPYFLILYGSK